MVVHGTVDNYCDLWYYPLPYYEKTTDQKMLKKLNKISLKQLRGNAKRLTEHGERLDRYLAFKFKDYSRTFFQRLIKNGSIRFNGAVITFPKTSVFENDKIEIDWPEENQQNKIPLGETFNFQVLFEDDDLIVINKPAGVVVHPAAGNWAGTVVNALIGRDSTFIKQLHDDNDVNSLQRPGIVHRLDKDTSGCLIIAKNIQSKKRLSEDFASRNIKKIYSAIVIGHPTKDKFQIKTLIGRHPVHRKKMAVTTRSGKEAITNCEVLKKGQLNGVKLSFLNINILTGRTHQIRVHLAHNKLPVLGDKVYGGRQHLNVPRVMLHAREITFPHPKIKKLFTITCDYPEDFKNFLEKIK